MKKRILGIRIRTMLLFFFAILLLMPLSVAWHQSVMNRWTPTDSMTGQWSGTNEVYAAFKRGQGQSQYPEDQIKISINILPDGSVTGTVGGAKLSGCAVKPNRTNFERLVHIKTDYIIRGSLIGGVAPADSASERTITIPFNLDGPELKGSLFEIEGWKYPDPLFPRMILTQETT